MDEEKDLCFRCKRDYDIRFCPLDDENITHILVDGPVVSCLEFEPLEEA